VDDRTYIAHVNLGGRATFDPNAMTQWRMWRRKGESKTKHWSQIRSLKREILKIHVGGFRYKRRGAWVCCPAIFVWTVRSLRYSYILRHTSRQRITHLAQVNLRILRAVVNPLEPHGLLFFMDGCIFSVFRMWVTIHNHYKPWRTKDIFKYISDCVRLKEDCHINLGWLEGE